MNHAEEVLYAHLTTVDSLDVLVEEGFSAPDARDVIPTQAGRVLVAWALEYYFTNGRKVAPTREAIMETWGDDLEAVDITIDDDTETDSVEWAIETLRSQFAYVQVQRFAKEFVTAMAAATGPERVGLVQDGAYSLHLLSQQLTSKRLESMAGAGFENVLIRHEEVRLSGDELRGMRFGLPPIDQYTFGVRPGELCVFAAASGVGKSWIAANTALAEWKAGRKVFLVTLENDLEMTFDRMACIEAGVDYELLQRGKLDQGSLDRVELIMKKLKDDPKQPIVSMLVDGQRDPDSIVRAALSKGADSLIIDQLDFIEKPPASKARELNQIIGETVKALKKAIHDGREMIPCLLLHQVNRDGQESSAKTGKILMTHMAGSSVVEKTADMIFVIFQSTDHRAAQQGEWQTVKIRRGKPDKRWEVWLRYDIGDIRVIREITDEEEED